MRRPGMPRVHFAPPPVVLDVELAIPQRVRPRDEDDRLVAGQPRHLGGLHEVSLEGAPVPGRRGGLAAALVPRDGRHGLLSHRLGDLLRRLVRLPTEEQQGVAAVDDRRRVVLVGGFELGERLEPECHRDVAAAHDRHHPLDVGQPPDVGELVHEQRYRHGKRAPVFDEGALAEDAHRLPEHDREQERVERGGVGHDGEHRPSPFGVAEPVELHLVAADELAHLGYGERLHARVAGDQDRLQGLSRRVLEHLVVEEGEVRVNGNGLGDLDPPAGACRVVGGPPRRVEALAVAAELRDAAHPGLHLLEKQVERAAVRLVRLLRLREREQGDHPRQRAVLGRAAVHQVPDERHVEEPLGVLPEGVSCVLAVPGRVLYEAGHELEDVRLVADVRQGVVVEGLGEVDRVERQYPVSRGFEHVPHPGQRLALRVGYEVVRVQLHDVGLEESPRLPGAGAAHHENVPVALEAPVVVGPVHRHPEVLREDDVSVGVLEVHESSALADGAPAGAAVLLALPLRVPVRERPRPGAPHGAGGHEPRRERGSLEREGAVA